MRSEFNIGLSWDGQINFVHLFIGKNRKIQRHIVTNRDRFECNFIEVEKNERSRYSI